MPTMSPLTGMQQHVLNHLEEVELQKGPHALRYDLRGRDVNAQIQTLVVKGLVAQDRQGKLSVV